MGKAFSNVSPAIKKETINVAIATGVGVVIMWGGHNTSAAGESGHGHELMIHLGSEATCETTGLKTYWECPECNLFFSDAEGFNAIAVSER